MSYVSVALTILLLERILFRLLLKFSGSQTIGYVLAGASSCLQVVSIVQWFAVTKSSFTADCELEANDIEFCAETGPILGICGAVLNCLGCLAAVVHLKYTGAQDNRDFMIEGRRMFTLSKVLPVLLITLFLEVFSLNWHWTHFKESTRRHNFMTYADSYNNYDHFGLNCIASASCDSSYQTASTMRECEAFDRLYEAGELLRKMKLGELVFAGLWLEGVGYLSTSMEFGVPAVQYLWPLLMLLTQVVALLTWSSKSAAAFSNNCEVLYFDTDIDFCSDIGVVLAIASIIVSAVAVTTFMIVYHTRYSFKIKVQPTPERPNKLFDEQLDVSQTADRFFDRTSSLIIDDSKTLAGSRSNSITSKRLRPLEPEMRPLSSRDETSCPLCKDK
jgi:hypothetical protein